MTRDPRIGRVPKRGPILPWRAAAVAVGTALLLSIAPGVGSPGHGVARADTPVFSHTCVVASGGAVKCWGSNGSGQLGDGTTADSLTPVTVSGISTATAVTTGDTHSCARLASGTLRCWGSNGSGQLGDGTQDLDPHPIPVTVTGITTATAIAAGGDHACAILADHTVRCWGSGYLGDGSTTDSSVPVAVSGISTATSVAAGGTQSCAVIAGGNVRCWGNNNQGQLGDGTTTDRLTPIAVSGISTATSVAAGRWHTCAVLSGGAAKCWGDNYSGQLGDGTQSERHAPVAVSGITTAAMIDAGDLHTCAVLTNGTARCWGLNYSGQLGDGTTTDSLTPVAVSGISAATGITTGDFHTCALLGNSTVWCWGSNAQGQLGDGTTTDRHTPVAVPGVAVPVPLTPFTDIAGSMFKPDIEWVYLAGITTGCSATLYCPEGYVTREQMASFLARALHLSGAAPDAFTDDEGSIHEPNINLVAKAGIASGCSATKYCPTGLVSREQMASFLARALHLSGAAPDAFTDDESSIHEPNINLVAREGIASGCGAGKYCPTQNVTRGQMAAFLHRAFGP